MLIVTLILPPPPPKKEKMHDLNKNNNLQLKKKEKEESLLVLIGCIIQQRGHCLVCMGRIKKQNNSKHSSIKPKIATKPTL